MMSTPAVGDEGNEDVDMVQEVERDASQLGVREDLDGVVGGV